MFLAIKLFIVLQFLIKIPPTVSATVSELDIKECDPDHGFTKLLEWHFRRSRVLFIVDLVPNGSEIVFDFFSGTTCLSEKVFIFRDSLVHCRICDFRFIIESRPGPGRRLPKLDKHDRNSAAVDS